MEGMSRPTKQARHLRKVSTLAERLLWRRLRNRQLGGFRFRRQHPVGSSIVDFYCEEMRLGVELDGGGHGHPANAAADLARTILSEKEGVRVIRFWNHEVRGNVEWVLDEILFHLDPAQSRWAQEPSP